MLINGQGFNIPNLTPTHGVRPANQPVTADVDDMSEAALEQFLSSWTSGTPGSDKLSLDQMLTIQAAASDVPQLPPVEPKVVNSTDHALRQIEMLVHQNRQIFQNATPRGMTDGWNIAGQR